MALLTLGHSRTLGIASPGGELYRVLIAGVPLRSYVSGDFGMLIAIGNACMEHGRVRCWDRVFSAWTGH